MARARELLFDTHSFLDVYQGRLQVRYYFDAFLTGDVIPYMSVMTEAEIWRRLEADDVDRHQAFIERFTMLPVRADAARLAGTWMQHYRNTGLGWMDALVVATAKVATIPVLTRDQQLASVLANEAVFELYGLFEENE